MFFVYPNKQLARTLLTSRDVHLKVTVIFHKQFHHVPIQQTRPSPLPDHNIFTLPSSGGKGITPSLYVRDGLFLENLPALPTRN